MSAPADTTEPSDGKRVELACPDCDARPAWISSATGWAKCSRCELAWPALERRFRGTPPVGAVVTLPDGWRVRREGQSESYRSRAREPELHVHFPAPLPWDVAAFLSSIGLWSCAAALLALGPPGSSGLAVWCGVGGLIAGVAGMELFRRRRSSAVFVRFTAAGTAVGREGRATVDVGAIERLSTRLHSRGNSLQPGAHKCALVLDTANEREVVLIAVASRWHVETVLREIGRHLGLSFDRENGELVARPKPTVARVRAPAPESSADAEGEAALADADARARDARHQASRGRRDEP